MPPRARKVSKKQQDSGKRYPVALRLGYAAREQLERAAMRSGRGLSAEAEARIEWTFRDDDTVMDVLRLRYGDFADVIMLAAYAANTAGNSYQIGGGGIGPHRFRVNGFRIDV